MSRSFTAVRRVRRWSPSPALAVYLAWTMAGPMQAVRLSAREAPAPAEPTVAVAPSAAEPAAQGSPTPTSLCGLGGTCFETGVSISSLLGIPQGQMVIDTAQPYDRVVKGTAAAAWAPLEWEARLVLSSIHGVPNDSRLPRFAAEDIRARILTRLIDLAKRKQQGATLLAVEQTALDAFVDAVREERSRAARLAVEEYYKWLNNPCGYEVPTQPDPPGYLAPHDAVAEPAVTLPFSAYQPGPACETFGAGSLTGPPPPPTVEQFIAYGAGRASGGTASADSQAALRRMDTAIAFAVGVTSAVVAGAIAAVLAASIPALAVGIAAAMGSTLAAAFLAGVGSAAIGTFGATSGAVAAAVGVGSAGGPVAVIIIAVLVTVIGTIQQVDEENILPTLQQKLANVSGTPDIVAMSNSATDGPVLLNAFMRQTFPDYTAARLANSLTAIPQARPLSAPRFTVGGLDKDVLETFDHNGGGYRQTFMAEGWFVTRTQPLECPAGQSTCWSPWRWSLSIPYSTLSGNRLLGVQPDAFIDMPFSMTSIATAVSTTSITARVFNGGSSDTVVLSGNLPPRLAARSTTLNIVANQSITFEANATDSNGGTIAGVKWFIEDPAYSLATANTKSFDACGFGPPPLDSGGQPTACPWKPYDGDTVTAVFARGGVYSVRALAIDNDGATAAQELQVNVASAIPTFSDVAVSSLSLQEGQTLVVSGSVDFPKHPQGYTSATRLIIDFGEGTVRMRDLPCSSLFFFPNVLANSVQCGFLLGGSFATDGPQGPWVFNESSVLAFRPDRPVTGSLPVKAYAISSDGGTSEVKRFNVSLTNVAPFLVAFQACDSAGLLVCDPSNTDPRSRAAGSPLTLRAYINDVAAAAHSISVAWGDGTSSVLDPGCSAPGCPTLVSPGPNIQNAVFQHPWKQFGVTHTYTSPGDYVAKIRVNDGGPNGLVSYTRDVTITGVGNIQGPTSFEGGTSQTFTLNKLLAPGASFVSQALCGIGTQTSWDGTTLTCAYQEVAARTDSQIIILGTLNGVPYTRTLDTVVLPKALTLSDLSGPTTVTAGGRALYSYSYSGPGAGVATTTFTPTCPGGATLFTSTPGSNFTCNIGGPTGPSEVRLKIQTSLGQTIEKSVAVTVVPDTTPPTISVPGDMVVDSTSNAGAQVFYLTGSSDDVTLFVLPSCSPAANSVFPIGQTMVNCSATDAAGNLGTASFKVTVLDKSAPILTVPANITTDATMPTGAAVSFTATATDAIPVAPLVSCSPASGSVFPAGSTTVTCSATDAAGNTASKQFSVTVRGAAAQMNSLVATIAALPSSVKTKNVLLGAANAALAAIQAGSPTSCSLLDGLIKLTNQARKSGLSNAQADAIIADANDIRAVLGCR